MEIFNQTLNLYISLPSVKEFSNKDFNYLNLLDTQQKPKIFDFIHHNGLGLIPPHILNLSDPNNFILIPFESATGKIFAFQARSISQKSFTVCRKSNFACYGLHRFKNFILNKPIIITEGVKDWAFLSQFYPFVLAALSTYISRPLFEMLKYLTNKILLAFDNDEPGRAAIKKLLRVLSLNKIHASCIYPSMDCKDFGDCFKYSEQQKEDFKLLLNNLIGRLENVCD